MCFVLGALRHECRLTAYACATSAVFVEQVIYTIPTGCNPTGNSLSLERRRKLYEIARKPSNNLVILEDDP